MVAARTIGMRRGDLLGLERAVAVGRAYTYQVLARRGLPIVAPAPPLERTAGRFQRRNVPRPVIDAHLDLPDTATARERDPAQWHAARIDLERAARIQHANSPRSQYRSLRSAEAI